MRKKKYRKFLVICDNGDYMPMAEHCGDLGLSYDTVLARINRLRKPFYQDKENFIFIHSSDPVFDKVKR